MKERITLPVSLNFPIDISKGDAGLFYVTSPMVRGLLVARASREEALAEVPKALGDLATAWMLEPRGEQS